MSSVFHLAFPVHNLEQAKHFYVDGLGCTPGRESHNALILNLGGHQLVAHYSPITAEPQAGIYPRHFGLILTTQAEWDALRDRAIAQELTFYQAPKQRFPGKPTEHYTFFLVDPSHNLLEFKHYVQASAIFGETDMAEVGDR